MALSLGGREKGLGTDGHQRRAHLLGWPQELLSPLPGWVCILPPWDVALPREGCLAPVLGSAGRGDAVRGSEEEKSSEEGSGVCASPG